MLRICGPFSIPNFTCVSVKLRTINTTQYMAPANQWDIYADHNKRMGWSDTNGQDRDWHAREQRRAEENARIARDREERQRQEAARNRGNRW